MSDYVLPVGVSRGDLRTVSHFSQKIDGQPYVNCVPYATCSVLVYAGLKLPLDFGMTIRVASGVPVLPGKGMSFGQCKDGVLMLLPLVDLFIDGMADEDLLLTVGTGEAFVIAVDCSKLDAGLRRYTGSYTGLHACSIQGYREVAGVPQVLWFDPMAGPRHLGRWIAWSRLKVAALRAGGLVRTMTCKVGSPLIDFPVSEGESALLLKVDEMLATFNKQNALMKEMEVFLGELYVLVDGVR